MNPERAHVFARFVCDAVVLTCSHIEHNALSDCVKSLALCA